MPVRRSLMAVACAACAIGLAIGGPADPAAAQAGPTALQIAQSIAAREAATLPGNGGRPITITADEDVGLFRTGADGGMTLPLRVFEEATEIGAVRALLALRIAYVARASEPRQGNKVVDAVLGYAGLLASESVTARDSADPVRRPTYYPSSELDNLPPPPDDGRERRLNLAAALGQGGCERNAVLMLQRLSRNADGPGRSTALRRDATRILRGLGMFAHAPAPSCIVVEDALFSRFKDAARS